MTSGSGSYGQGGYGSSNSGFGSGPSCGGGGGYYGGGGGCNCGFGVGGGGGGSGYIGGVPSFSYKGVTYSPSTSVGGNSGNGWAKITLVKKLEINIVYDGNGGSGSMENTIISADDYEAASASTTFATKTNTYARTGYDFSGTWIDNSGNAYDDGHAISKGEIDSTGGFVDRTWYAKWIPHTYTIRYNKNGADNLGGVVMADETFTYHDAYGRNAVTSPAGNLNALKEAATTALSANRYTKTGYHFVGWSTKSVPGSTDTIYADCYSLCDISPTNGAKVTLYAQWEPNTYYVVVHDNAVLSEDHTPIGDNNTNRVITAKYDSYVSLLSTINTVNSEYAALHADEPILVTGLCYNPSTCYIAQDATPADQSDLRVGDGTFVEFPVNNDGNGYTGSGGADLNTCCMNLTPEEDGYVHVYCIRDVYRWYYDDNKPIKVIYVDANGENKVAGAFINDDGSRNRDNLVFGH